MWQKEQATLAADLRHMTACWDLSDGRAIVAGLLRAPFYPKIGAVVCFRIASVAYRRQATRPIAHWLKARSIRRSGAEIHPAAEIGPGFALVHSVGIVVGRARAGRNLVLHQNVTIGGNGLNDEQPVLGDNVRIFAGGKVIGAITVGNDVTIAADALVLADVPDGTTVVGVWRGRPES